MKKFRESKLYDSSLGSEITQFLDETIQNFAKAREVLQDSIKKNNPDDIPDDEASNALYECLKGISIMYYDGVKTSNQTIQELIDLYKIFARSNNHGFHQPGSGYIIMSIGKAQKLAKKIGGEDGKDRFTKELIKMFDLKKENKMVDMVNQAMFKLAILARIDSEDWHLDEVGNGDWYMIAQGLGLDR